jgi:hypothetical protein
VLLCIASAVRLARAQAGPATLPAAAPSGAVVLFDGKNLEHWTDRGGAPARWEVIEGAMQAGGGDVRTRQSFGDFDLHVEFLLPHMPEARGQGRGNSGVYLHGIYEIQVLDSYGVSPPGKGDAGAIYNQHPPTTNASQPPQTWQSYDIRFRAPRFDAQGAKTANARVTVVFNGVTIHGDVEIAGPTPGGISDSESSKGGPILLQDHGNPVRYRNIWIVPR